MKHKLLFIFFISLVIFFRLTHAEVIEIATSFTSSNCDIAWDGNSGSPVYNWQAIQTFQVPEKVYIKNISLYIPALVENERNFLDSEHLNISIINQSIDTFTAGFPESNNILLDTNRTVTSLTVPGYNDFIFENTENHIFKPGINYSIWIRGNYELGFDGLAVRGSHDNSNPYPYGNWYSRNFNYGTSTSVTWTSYETDDLNIKIYYVTVGAILNLYSNMTKGNYTDNPLKIKYWGIVENTQDIFNCSLYLNNSLNQTQLNVNITQNNIFIINTSNWEKGYYFNITCLNNNASNSVKEYMYIDTIPPELDISSNIINNSIIYNNITELRYNVTFQDTNLYAVNHTFRKGDITLKNDFIENLNITEYVINYSENMAILGLGNFSIEAQAWDSHTNKKIKDKVKIENNKLKYKGITFFCEEEYNLTYEIDKDKIKPIVKFKKDNNKCYYAGYKFTKIVNSKYPNHYVDFQNKIWIDEYKHKINKISDNLLEIKIKDKKYKGNSIGDLNYNRKVWYFSIQEAPVTVTGNDTILLTQILNETQNIKEYARKSQEAMNMLWYWILFIIALIMPFIFKVITTKQEDLNMIVIFSTIILSLLTYFTLKTDYIVFTNSLKTLLGSIFMGIALIYAQLFIETT